MTGKQNMSDFAIQVHSLGKKYTIGHSSRSDRYVALRDVVAQQAGAYWRRTKDMIFGRQVVQGESVEDLWALKDLSFEIKHGEAIGIIGRNGAGKSTLLKILSRITEPSAGRAVIAGRIASLLEVGTGFHPELTGRENVFLNGAILGMSRSEVRRKFDEIVAFAEIEKFLDTPVKRYSSGMYVRLAFAVAAHLEPDILLVDEVLAVGDAAFQKKCLGKMSTVASEGRTVLFVSHNIGTISELCFRSLWIENGRLKLDGPSNEVIKHYLASTSVCSRMVDVTKLITERTVDSSERVLSISYENGTQKQGDTLVPGDTLAFKAMFNLQPGNRYHVAITVRDESGTTIYNCPNSDADFSVASVQPVETVQILFPNIELAPGRYFVSIWFADSANRLIERAVNCIAFDVALPLGKQYRGRGCIYKVPNWSMYAAADFQ